MKIALTALLPMVVATSATAQIWGADAILSVSTLDELETGEAGDSVVWLLPDATRGVMSEVRYFSQNDSTCSVLDAQTVTRFGAHADSVFYHGFENRMFRLAYTPPLFLRMQAPTLADSVASALHGQGLYCDRLPIKTDGLAYSVVDGHGELRNSKRIIGDVYRVHHHQEFDTYVSKCDSDSTSKSIGMTMVDIYEWWQTGMPFPEMQTIHVQSKRGEAASDLVCYTRVRCADDNVGLDATEEDLPDEAKSTDGVSCDVATITSTGDVVLSLQSSTPGVAEIGVYDVSSQCLGRSTVDFSSSPRQMVSVKPQRRPVGGSLIIHVTLNDSQKSFNIPIHK